MQDAFWIFSVLYVLFLFGLVALAIFALWRIVKAQEATADALQRIAHAVSRLGPPA
jgi:uncharacterized membrane protein